MTLAPLERRFLQGAVLHDEIARVGRVVYVSCVVKASDEGEALVSAAGSMFESVQ